MRNEGDTGFVGADNVAGFHLDAADLHGAVHLDGLHAPLAGDRREALAPYRPVHAAVLVGVAHGGIDNGADETLTFGDGRRLAAHVGAAHHALDHQHVAGLGEVVRFGFTLATGFIVGCFVDLCGMGDVAHRQRRADDAPAEGHRRQHIGRHHGDEAEFVTGIRQCAGQVDEIVETVKYFGGDAWKLQHANGFARQFAESGFGHVLLLYL